MKQEGVALVPGGAFGDDRWVRLSYAVSDTELERALGQDLRTDPPAGVRACRLRRRRVSVEARVEPLTGSLPSIGWRWDPETDILSGAFKGNRKSGGLTGTVELTDAEGSVAVLDVNNGVICGLDVVVWPEVTTSTDPPGAGAAHRRSGRPAGSAVPSRRGVGRGGYDPVG